MTICLIFSAVALLAASGVPGLFLGRGSPWGQRIAAGLSVAGAVLGLCGALGVLLGGDGFQLRHSWRIPLGEFSVSLDPLGAFFLVPVFLMAGLGPIYGLGYWRQADHPDSGRKLQLFYGLFTAAMAGVVLSADGVLFLMSWEVMALTAFFLVTAEDDDPAVRQAGWIYLIATHLGTLCLLGMFALLATTAATSAPLPSSPFALRAIQPGQAGTGIMTAIFLLALAGFGLKAGLMPLHVWLPPAHAAAPSHVSALMSGVFIKMGIYSLVRMTSLLPHPPAWWGGLLLLLGALSGVLGVVYAIAQHDIKRLLAYHSIENIGIIVMGLGLAMVGRSAGRADWVALGLAGALLHVWNHALFKSLLFLAAGSVVHATGTRQIDRLGGLAKAMPWTAGAFLIGAVAICGLPPLNGFVSELFVYLGAFRSMDAAGGATLPAIALVAATLALIGALALACFVKVFGAAFLGVARTPAAEHRHEAGPTMLGPMAVIAACCFAIGLAPMLVTPLLDRTTAFWTQQADSAAAAPPAINGLLSLRWVSILGAALVGLTLVGYGLLRRRITVTAARARPATVGTWDCGYAGSSPRIQYTASSFGQMLVGLSRWAVRPQVHRPQITGLFPAGESFSTHVGDWFLEGLVLRLYRYLERFLTRFRFVQQGRVQFYVLWILLALIGLLLCLMPIGSFFQHLFGQ